MARRGRRPKSGKRTASGRLARDGYAEPIYDRGTVRAQERARQYGTHGASAIGRAYVSGLLGDERQAKIRYDAGKRFQRAVDRFFHHHPVTCAIGRQVRLGATVALLDTDHDRAEWDWLNHTADALDQRGLRPWLDQLTISLYADRGPDWIDRLLNGGKHPADLMMLKAAIDALDLIAPSSQPIGIRAVRS